MPRVLVVDDDTEIRALLEHILINESLEVDCARNGREALALMRQHEYAVMLLDLMMPEMNGFEMLEVMRTERHPVVLVVTGAGQSTIDELDSRIVHGIIRKPFEPEELARVVRACAEIRDSSGLGTMAFATMLAGGPLIAFLSAKM